MILGDWGRAVSISLFLKFYFKGTRSFIFKVKSAAFPVFGYDCSSFTLMQKDQDDILCSLAGENQQSAAAPGTGKMKTNFNCLLYNVTEHHLPKSPGQMEVDESMRPGPLSENPPLEAKGDRARGSRFPFMTQASVMSLLS